MLTPRTPLRRSLPSSPTSPKGIPPTLFYQCRPRPTGQESRSSLGRSASVSTLHTVSSTSVTSLPSLADRTIAGTTIATISSSTSPRPSLQKPRSTSLSMRRQRARGLSIASKTSQLTMPPPVYQEVDPNPNPPSASRIGLAF